MILYRLYIKNFGCFVEQTFEFDQQRSIFMLHGRNGRGKSTVLQALSLLLTNDTKDTLKDLIRWGQQEFELELEFSHDNHHYLEKINCDGNATRILIVDGDTENPLKNSDAIKFLAEIIDPRMFKSSAMAMQNDIDLIKTSPADRRDYLMKVYDLDFKKSVESLEAEHRLIELQLASNKTEKQNLEAATYDFIDMVRPPFGEKGLIKRQTDADDLQRYLTLVEAEIETQRQLDSDILKLEKSLDELKVDLTAATQARQNNDKAVEETQKKQKKELDDIDATFDKKSKDLETDKLRLEALIAIEPKFEETASYSDDVDLKRQHVNDIENQIAQLQKSIDLHQQGLCPTCGSIFDGHDLPKLNAELSEYQEKLVASKALLTTSQDRLKDYETSKRDHDRAVVVWNNTKEELTRVEAQLVTQKQDRIDTRQRMLDSQKQLSDQQTITSRVLAENVKKLETSVDQALADLSAKQTDKKNRAAIDQTTIDQKTAQLDLVKAEISTYNSIIAANLAAEKTNKSLMTKQTTDKARAEELRTSIVADELRLVQHVTAIKIFKRDFPSYVVTSMLSGIVGSMNDFLAQTYNSRQYEVFLEEAKNGIRLLYGPNKAEVSRLSGYESQVFSSAWRHAREELSGFGIVFLDEVESAADTENAEALYRVLCETNLYHQMLVISHKDSTKELLEQEYDAQIFTLDGVA